MINLEPEIRSGYQVTTEIKKLWNEQLKMLKKVLEVCEKYNIKLMTDGGTMLGSIRHQGYIPWDDDIDMMLFRDDYNRFVKIPKEEFEPYFFQTIETDNIFNFHAQIRKNNTSALLKYDYRQKHHRGIFIDIFPYDIVPKKNKWIKLKRKLRIYMKIGRWAQNSNKINSNNFFSLAIRTCVKLVAKTIVLVHGGRVRYFKHIEKKMIKVGQKYRTNTIGNIFMSLSSKEFFVPAECIKDTITMKFENMEVHVPQGYDEYLKSLYNDYMKFQIGTSIHGKMVVDLDLNYNEYDKLSIENYRKLFK